MAISLAVFGVLAALLAWRTGCGPDSRRLAAVDTSGVATGDAGQSSGIAEDLQQRAANRAGEVPQTPLTDLAVTFQDQDGHVRRLSEFRGRPWVVSAIYTRCVTVCPRIVDEFRALEKDPAWASDKSWKGVLISLDPGFDRPPVLRAFAEARGLDPARWSLLVPDSASLAATVRALGLLARDDPSGGIAHTAVFTMVGADGRIADRRVGFILPAGGLALAWRRPRSP